MRSPCRPLPALVLALPLMVAGPALAGVFKCKGPDGTTIFQDSECGPASQSLQAPKAGTGREANTCASSSNSTGACGRS